MEKLFLFIIGTILIVHLLNAILDALKKKTSQELCLKYQHEKIHAKTVAALISKLIRKGNIDVVLEGMGEEQSLQVRNASATALGILLENISNPTTIQSILKRIEEKDWILQSKVIATLGKTANNRTIPFLLSSLH